MRWGRGTLLHLTHLFSTRPTFISIALRPAWPYMIIQNQMSLAHSFNIVWDNVIKCNVNIHSMMILYRNTKRILMRQYF